MYLKSLGRGGSSGGRKAMVPQTAIFPIASNIVKTFLI